MRCWKKKRKNKFVFVGMKDMNMRTIEECFYQIRNGVNIKQGIVDGGYPITRIETIANDKFNRDRMGYAGITDLEKYESYVLEDGDLLMSHINSVQYLGRTVLYKKQGKEKIIHGMNLLGLKARRDIIRPTYARYYFYSRPFREQVERITKKSVNQASFAVVDLKKIKICVPDLSTQDRVVDILDLVNQIVEERQQELLQLDELIKARFVETFGTLHENENGFDVVRIEDVCSLIKDGTHQTPKYTEDKNEGYKFLSSKDVMSQKIDWTNIKYIPAELHEKLYGTIKPQRNDILMSKNGVNYGVAAVNDTDEVFDIYVSLALLRPKAVIDPVFLRCVINNPETKRQFDLSIKGIGVPNLHLGEIKKTKIFLPPMEFQRKFVSFVEQVDKSKVAVQKALDETQLLFDSLMQKYFG